MSPHSQIWLSAAFAFHSLLALATISIENGESADSFYAKMEASDRNQLPAPTALPKGATDEESREYFDSVLIQPLSFGVRLSKRRPVLWHRVPGLRAKQERPKPELHYKPARSNSPFLATEGQERRRGAAAGQTRRVNSLSRPTRVVTPTLLPPLPPRGAACGPRSLFPRAPAARNHSARTPSNSSRDPASSR